MTKSLVTGGAGFIGSHIVEELLKLGHEVVVIDNEYSDNDNFVWRDDVENHKESILNYSKTRKLYKNVDYVFHAAAEARIGPAIKNPINAVKVNSLGTCTVLQCAREAGVKRVMYSSTSSGYGLNSSPNIETQPDDCLNPYSVSKISGEKMCKMYSELYNLPTIVFRYFNVFGEGAPTRGQYAPVTGIFFRQHAAGEPLTIVGDGKQRRDFIYVKDVARANVLSALRELEPKHFGEVYNVGSGSNISVKDLANLITDNQIHIDPRPGEAQTSLANIDKIKRVIGWEPTVSIEQWVKDKLKENA
jgi:UDP-glucose 4-epimerase